MYHASLDSEVKMGYLKETSLSQCGAHLPYCNPIHLIKFEALENIKYQLWDGISVLKVYHSRSFGLEERKIRDGLPDILRNKSL